jgi:hypothetical protein
LVSSSLAYSYLQKHLSARGIPPTWVASAVIELDFKPTPPAKRVPIMTWGNLFKLAVTITDDLKKNHAVFAYGYCAPHNPIRESRSARAERF